MLLLSCAAQIWIANTPDKSTTFKITTSDSLSTLQQTLPAVHSQYLITILIFTCLHSYEVLCLLRKALERFVWRMFEHKNWNHVVCLQGAHRKVKCTFVQALRLCVGCMAHRGSRDIALLFLDRGTSSGWGVSSTPWPLFTPRERPSTHCTVGWVGPRAGLERCRKSRPYRDSIPWTVASRCIVYTTRPTMGTQKSSYILFLFLVQKQPCPSDFTYNSTISLCGIVAPVA